MVIVVIKRIDIPNKLKISYVNNASNSFWRINLIPYYDYINLGIHIIREVTGVADISYRLLYNLLYWTEYLHIKGALGELPVSHQAYFSVPSSPYDFNYQEIEAVGMCSKLSTIVWDCPQNGCFLPSPNAVNHITLAGYIPIDEQNLSVPKHDVVIQELFYTPGDTTTYTDIDLFLKSSRYRYYTEVENYMRTVFSGLIFNYSKCLSESMLFSEITRHVAWEPPYPEQKGVLHYELPKQITYLHNDAVDRPLCSFDWTIKNTKPQNRSASSVNTIYPYGDFASAQATYISRAQYCSIFKMPHDMFIPDKRLWLSLIRHECPNIVWDKEISTTDNAFKSEDVLSDVFDEAAADDRNDVFEDVFDDDNAKHKEYVDIITEQSGKIDMLGDPFVEEPSNTKRKESRG